MMIIKRNISKLKHLLLMSRSALLIFGLALTLLPLRAQDFEYKSAINQVNAGGFYKIQLVPEITSKMKSDWSDIRIYDAEKKEVPYILSEENRVTEHDLFV